MQQFLALETRAVLLCERLMVLRSIYAQPPSLYLSNNKRTNNKWKSEISQFTTNSFAEIYQLWVRQDAKKQIFLRNFDSINFLVNQLKQNG